MRLLKMRKEANYLETDDKKVPRNFSVEHLNKMCQKNEIDFLVCDIL